MEDTGKKSSIEYLEEWKRDLEDGDYETCCPDGLQLEDVAAVLQQVKDLTKERDELQQLLETHSVLLAETNTKLLEAMQLLQDMRSDPQNIELHEKYLSFEVAVS